MPASRHTSDASQPQWVRALAVASVLSQLVVATGAPLPSVSSKASDSSVPFPCQNRPCSCRTAEQCWAGKCCCFTMREKVAWALSQGHMPPAHAFRIAQQEETETAGAEEPCPLCSKAKIQQSQCPKATPEPQPSKGSIRWVIGVHALGCRGESAEGVSLCPPSLPIDLSPVMFVKSVAVDLLTWFNDSPIACCATPPVPPPKAI